MNTPSLQSTSSVPPHTSTNPDPGSDASSSVGITNKDELRDKIHSIHNFLRNHGAGYGMNALKVFNIVYGLFKIEKQELFERFQLNDVCRFSTLLAHAERSETNNDEGGDKDLLHSKFFGHGEYVDNSVLDELHGHAELKNILFYEIPKNMSADTLVQLFKEISSLEEVENRTGVQLAGKVYEYFIGRDSTAISELGAYFTDRNITDFIFNEIAPVRLSDDGQVPEMIDMFGGSGGFTISYVRRMLLQAEERGISIDWDTQSRKIHHYDMNEDVIRSAALELMCLTGSLPVIAHQDNTSTQAAHMGYKNSFKDEFQNRKFKYIYTNPPYGGDNNKGSANINKRKKLISVLTQQLKDSSNHFTDEVRKAKTTQLNMLKKENINDVKMQQANSVSLETSSRRVQHYARTYGGFAPPPMATKKKQTGLTAKDKEAVSLVMLMDMLAAGGTAVGVLKEGVFFNAKYKELRALLLTNYNVREVISVPSDAFENTTTKTSILVFDAAPEGETICTDTVRFSKIVVDKYTKDKISESEDGSIYIEEAEGDIFNMRREHISEVSYSQIATQKDWALDPQKYHNEETALQVKEGWKLVAVGDVCSLFIGRTPNTKEQAMNWTNGSNPWISITDMKTGDGNVIHHTKKKITDAAAKSFNGRVLQRGDILLSFKLSMGKVSVVGKDGMYCNEAIACLRPKESVMSKEDFLPFLRVVANQFEEHANGTIGKGNLNKQSLVKLKIPLPTTEALRTHWTNRVSTPYEAKKDAEKRIAEIEATVQSMVKDVVETEGACDWVALEDVCSFALGKVLSKKNFEEGIIPVIGGGKSPTGFHNKPNRPPRTILCSASGNSAGYISRYESPVWASDCFSISPSNSNLGNDLLYLLLKSYQEDIYQLQYGSAQPHLKPQNLKAFKIPLPKSPTFQAELQPHFDELDRLRQQVKTHEAEYKQALVDLREAAIE